MLFAFLMAAAVTIILTNRDFVPTREYGLCSQVFQMYEYCSGTQQHNLPVSDDVQPLGGEAGPPGISGKAAVVNYTTIYEKIDEKFAEYQAANEVRLEKYEARIENLEKGIAKYQAANEVRLEKYEARIENLEKELNPDTFTDCGNVSSENTITRTRTGGVYDINTSYKKLQVFCDTITEGGGWLVFQRRMDGSVDFYRAWDHYVNGFGNNTEEFWLGLETLHQLTSSATYELRIDMEDWEGNTRFAKYSTFRVSNAAFGYRLNIGRYSGNAGDSLTEVSNGQAFTTKDRDSDTTGSENCAVTYKGAWWYKACHHSNLNGYYFKDGVHKSFADGIEWYHWKGYHYSLKFTEMKMRIVN